MKNQSITAVALAAAFQFYSRFAATSLALAVVIGMQVYHTGPRSMPLLISLKILLFIASLIFVKRRLGAELFYYYNRGVSFRQMGWISAGFDAILFTVVLTVALCLHRA